MTTVTAWLSVSATGTKTFYLGADSQGTCLQTGKILSLCEKKVSGSSTTPEIFAMSGDLQWGSMFLRRVLTEISRGSIASARGTQKRAEEFCELPCARPPMKPYCELEILYGVRGDSEMALNFKMYRLRHSGSLGANWKVDQFGQNELNSERSVLVYSSGTGGHQNRDWHEWISKGDQGYVSRTCFWSLCDLVNGIPLNKFMTGGHPQLVKLDQVGNGSAVGVKFNGVPTVYGRRTSNPQNFANFWVDENFTQLNPETLEKYSQAQRYGRGVCGR